MGTRPHAGSRRHGDNLKVDSEAGTLRLQTALRDLAALFAIPVAWTGKGPAALAAGLADALVALLQLDFAFVRLRGPDGGAVDVTRGDAWKGFPDWLGTGRWSHLAGWRELQAARAFVHGLPMLSAWQAFARSSQRPPDIPSHPDKT